MEPVTKNLPVIAMRGLNVFPRMNTSFDLERPISVHALERAMENGEEIFLVTQREIGVEQPEEKDLYEIGTVARVTQILRVSDRVLRVMMEGACRARLKRLWPVSYTHLDVYKRQGKLCRAHSGKFLEAQR